MIRYKNVASIAAFLILLISCENDNVEVGGGLFDSSDKLNKTAYVDLVAYSELFDTARTSRNYLPTASIGAYSEPLFGETKASLVSQARLTTINPDFGKNPIIDSAVLFIPVSNDATPVLPSPPSSTYIAGGDTLVYNYTNYKIDPAAVYGNTSATMTLQVDAVNTFLGTATDTQRANTAVSLGATLGTKQISNLVTRREVVFNGESILTESAAYTVRLDNNYFQTNILNQQGTVNLADQASFVNWFKGIQIGVTNNNGFIFNTTPAGMSITLFYKNDSIRSGGLSPASYVLDLSNSNNATYGKYQNAGAPAISSANPTTGDEKLYLQGLSGSRVKLRLNDAQISQIQDSVKNAGWVINNAVLKFYRDTSVNLPVPNYLFAYVEDLSTPTSPKQLLLDDYYLESVEKLDRFQAGTITPLYNSTDNYYSINMTEHFKNIVEKDTASDGSLKKNYNIIVGVGNLIGVTNTTGFYTGLNPYYQDRSYNPYRVVVYGNNTTDNTKKLRLELSYTKK